MTAIRAKMKSSRPAEGKERGPHPLPCVIELVNSVLSHRDLDLVRLLLASPELCGGLRRLAGRMVGESLAFALLCHVPAVDRIGHDLELDLVFVCCFRFPLSLRLRMPGSAGAKLRG